MNIQIKTIPHKEQRYPTCGDWWFDPNGSLQIRVSELSDWRYEALIATHELWEAILCKKRKILAPTVDKFDMAYEIKRPPGDESEPGDDKDAPYRQEHCSACGIERLLASELVVPWYDYADEIADLE